MLAKQIPTLVLSLAPHLLRAGNKLLNQQEEEAHPNPPGKVVGFEK